MNRLSTDELRALVEVQGYPCVSLYMPTHRIETRQDTIRLRNLLREAETRLLAAEGRAPDVAALLEPGQALLGDSFFWRHCSDGLAVFLAPAFQRLYALPRAFPERLVIGRRFHIKPLLPLLGEGGAFYVLALSQNSVRLMAGTHSDLEVVPVERLPHSLVEALQLDTPERAVRFRTAESIGPGRWSAVVYGSTAEDPAKDELSQFCQRVDHGLRDLLHAEPVPLVLAGVDYLIHIYRGVSQYAHLMPGEVVGNPEKLELDELHRRAWAAVQPHFQRRQLEAAQRFRQLGGTRRVATALRPILAAAREGRVETLFVEQGQVQWGAFDPETGAVHQHMLQEAADEDLFDLAATQVILNGGTVYSVPTEAMPVEGPLAAVFRY